MMFAGGFDTGIWIFPWIVGSIVIPMSVESDNFIFTCEPNTLQ